MGLNVRIYFFFFLEFETHENIFVEIHEMYTAGGRTMRNENWVERLIFENSQFG